ncbi:MAG: DUF1972 domain-containing protein [Melioribacteraceae bacterium]|nr:DUF1972 domain-containing protein [Melioribacteraceae bacterium]
MKKVAIVGTNGLPAKYGGFETLTNYLTINLRDNYKFIVYCSKNNDLNRSKEFNGAKLIHLPLNANGFQSIFYDIFSMLHAIFFADTLLVLGTPGAVIFPFIKIFNKKIVVNFGGLEWKREKWPIIARKYLKLTEKIAVNFADVVVADNQAFINYINKEYGVDATLIEYGGDHVLRQGFGDNLFEKYPFVKDKYLLSVSRAQIDNNIHLLLEAFDKSNSLTKLVIISNWGSSEYGISLKDKYSTIKNIILLNAVYDQLELDFIRNNAYLYIHTHSFCGTAPSLVEAMNHELSIVCFDVDTNRYTTENQCKYFKDVDELVAILENNENNLENIKTKMYAIAEKRYRWEIISNKYSELF